MSDGHNILSNRYFSLCVNPDIDYPLLGEFEMKKSSVLALIITLGAIYVSNESNAQCPDPARNETALDCPWAEAARAISNKSDPVQIRTILNEKLPGFMNEIDLDATAKDMINLWGLSRNVEDSTSEDGPKIIPVNLLRFLIPIWGVSYNDTFTEGNAGLNHTYGYLLSTLQTRNGYKRERYIHGEIEEGFGLPAGTFSGIPPKGTLFSNLTKFAGTIAFRDNPDCLRELSESQESGRVTKLSELESFPYRQLPIKRLLEVARGEHFQLEMRTDIVPFIKPNTKGKSKFLLVYSVDFRVQGLAPRPRLLTAFPIEESVAKTLLDPAGMGDKLQLKLRYGSTLPVSISTQDMIGKRSIAIEGR